MADGKHLERELSIHQDAGQQIIEIVRYAGGPMVSSFCFCCSSCSSALRSLRSSWSATASSPGVSRIVAYTRTRIRPHSLRRFSPSVTAGDTDYIGFRKASEPGLATERRRREPGSKKCMRDLSDRLGLGPAVSGCRPRVPFEDHAIYVAYDDGVMSQVDQLLQLDRDALGFKRLSPLEDDQIASRAEDHRTGGRCISPTSLSRLAAPKA
jgi:hypothetical protein